MIGKDIKQIKDFYDYKRSKFLELNIKVPDEFIYNKYDIIRNTANHIKIKVNIFKGESFAEREKYVFNKMKMIRIKVDYSHLLSKKVLSISDIIVKETIENVDIQFELLENFLKQKYKPQAVKRALLPIYDKYDGAKVGDYLGYIFLNYDDFTGLINFLKPSFGILKKKKIF